MSSLPELSFLVGFEVVFYFFGVGSSSFLAAGLDTFFSATFFVAGSFSSIGSAGAAFLDFLGADSSSFDSSEELSSFLAAGLDTFFSATFFGAGLSSSSLLSSSDDSSFLAANLTTALVAGFSSSSSLLSFEELFSCFAIALGVDLAGAAAFGAGFSSSSSLLSSS